MHYVAASNQQSHHQIAQPYFTSTPPSASSFHPAFQLVNETPPIERAFHYLPTKTTPQHTANLSGVTKSQSPPKPKTNPSPVSLSRLITQTTQTNTPSPIESPQKSSDTLPSDEHLDSIDLTDLRPLILSIAYNDFFKFHSEEPLEPHENPTAHNSLTRNHSDLSKPTPWYKISRIRKQSIAPITDSSALPANDSLLTTPPNTLVPQSESLLQENCEEVSIEEVILPKPRTTVTPRLRFFLSM